MRFQFASNSTSRLWIFILLSIVSGWAMIYFVILEPQPPLQVYVPPSIRPSVLESTESAVLVRKKNINSIEKRLTNAVTHSDEFSRIDFSDSTNIIEAIEGISRDQLERVVLPVFQLSESEKNHILKSVVGEMVKMAQRHVSTRKEKADPFMYDLYAESAPTGYIQSILFFNTIIHAFSKATLSEIQRAIAQYDPTIVIRDKQVNWVFSKYIQSRIASSTFAYMLDESKYPNMLSALRMLERDYDPSEPVQCVGWVSLLNAIPGMYMAENIAGYALRPYASMMLSVIDAYNYHASLPPIFSSMKSRSGTLIYYAGQNTAYRFSSVEDIHGGDVGFYGNHTFAVIGLFKNIDEQNPYGLPPGDYILVSESNRSGDGLPHTFFVSFAQYERVIAPINTTVYLRSKKAKPDILEETAEDNSTELPPVLNEGFATRNASVPLAFRLNTLKYLILHRITKRTVRPLFRGNSQSELAELSAYHVEHVWPEIAHAWKAQSPKANTSDWIVQSIKFWLHALSVVNQEVGSTYNIGSTK